MRVYRLCLLLLLLSVDAIAQHEVHQLSVVVARAEREPLSLAGYGQKEWELDSARLAAYKGQSIATLLTQQLPVFIKTYGTNGLATLSLRGASAAQTAVQWNGVPLQSGSTGLVDLMLIPTSVVDNVTLNYGSNGGKVGSGAVGGVLSLHSNAQIGSNNSSQHLFLSAGSFGRLQAGFRLQESRKKVGVTLVAIGLQANNDFDYTDNNGIQRRLSNASLKSGNIMLNSTIAVTKKSFLSGSVWYNKASREIPPALFEMASVKQQTDEALRATATYGRSSDNYIYSLQASVIDEWFRYQDTASLLKNRLHTRQVFAKPSIRKRLADEKISLNLSTPFQWNYLVAIPEKSIVKAALAADLQGFYDRTVFSVDARAEAMNGKLFGAGGINVSQHFKRASIRGSAGYAYRNPTLNELYYTPGGNPDLLSEQGFNADAGYSIVLKSSPRFGIVHKGTGFYRNMENWILWFGGAIWTPHNIARVVSKGYETENKIWYKTKKATWNLRLNASYTSSKTVESIIANDGSINKQIPYTPSIIGQGSLSFNAKNWRLEYNHTYTGLRYFNTDETGEIPAFTTGNLQAGYLIQRKHWSYDLSMQVQNIWNNRYAEVAFRPAPGVNWLAGVSLTHSR